MPFVPACGSQIQEAVAVGCTELLEPAHPQNPAVDSEPSPGPQSEDAGLVSARTSRGRTPIGAGISTPAQKAPLSSPVGLLALPTTRS